VQLLPFVPAVAMLLGAINHVRRLALWGVLAAVAVIAIGIVDLGYVARLGWIEIAIGGAAGAVSLASRSGTFRPIAGEP
jgi:hypothetical protein